jgi:hypothetical protein
MITLVLSTVATTVATLVTSFNVNIPPQHSLSPTQAHWALQANRLSAGQAGFSLGLGLYRDCGPLPRCERLFPCRAVERREIFLADCICASSIQLFNLVAIGYL